MVFVLSVFGNGDVAVQLKKQKGIVIGWWAKKRKE